MNRARILDEKLTVNRTERTWTLGNYLQVVKKAPSNVMLGIGTLSISTLTPRYHYIDKLFGILH